MSEFPPVDNCADFSDEENNIKQKSFAFSFNAPLPQPPSQLKSNTAFSFALPQNIQNTCGGLKPLLTVPNEKSKNNNNKEIIADLYSQMRIMRSQIEKLTNAIDTIYETITKLS